MSIYLKPDKVHIWNGVTVNQYFLTDHNPNKIALPLKRSGDVIGTTIHNTGRISVKKDTTPAEQYLRATVNGNMNSVRVHLYVDDVCAWLCLPLTYSSWHAGHTGRKEAHGSERGNAFTLSIECIMNGSGDEKDIKARDNAARIAAYLLDLYGGELYTHNYWENIRNGRRGSIDELNKLNDGYKNCPIYIRPKWDDFKALVKSYRSQYKSLYYVQVGAFKKEDNARAFLETVKKAYPSAFVKENGLYYVQVGAFSDLNNANNYLQFVKQDYPSAFIKTF